MIGIVDLHILCHPQHLPLPPSPSNDHKREAALSLVTDLRDLDGALGEAKAICKLVPVNPKMEDHWLC